MVAKAKEIAAYLRRPDFEGTTGWLSKWKKHYNVKRATICGESGDVSGGIITSWKGQKLYKIMRNKIFSTQMRQALFGEHCQTVDSVKRGSNARQGWEKEQMQIHHHVLIECSGEKETDSYLEQ